MVSLVIKLCIIILVVGVNGNIKTFNDIHINSKEKNLTQTIQACSIETMPIYPVGIEKYYEYMNGQGDVVTNCKFEAASCYAENRARVQKDGQYGFLDERGYLLVPCQFEDANEAFSEGLCGVCVDGKWGYIDVNGDIVMEFQYSYARPFSEGVAVVCPYDSENREYDIINKNGDVLMKFEMSYYPVGDCHDGMIQWGYRYVSFADGKFICNEYGRNGFMGMYPEEFSEGLAVYNIMKEDYAKNYSENYWNQEAWNYYYVNTAGEMVLGPYDSAEKFSEGLAVVCRNGQYQCIDRNGNTQFILGDVSLEKEFRAFSENRLVFCNKDGQYGFVDKTGSVVIEPVYDDIVRDFQSGIAVMKIGEKYIYIDKNGKMIR